VNWLIFGHFKLRSLSLEESETAGNSLALFFNFWSPEEKGARVPGTF
jgi:hypothetical protein